jgi:hypothetical protein
MSAIGFVLVPAFLILSYWVLNRLGLDDIRTGPFLNLILFGSPLASAGTLFALYRWKIRPLVSWSRASERARAQPTATALRMVKALRQIHSRSTRRALGGIAANFFAVRDLDGRGDGLDASTVEALVFAAYGAARQLDLYDAHLAGRSLMRIKEELDRTAVRIAHASETPELERLVKAKADLEQELGDYRETEDRRSRTHLAVLAAAGTLERLRNARQGREDCRELDAEIRALARDLGGDRPGPLDPPAALNPPAGLDEEPPGQP